MLEPVQIVGQLARRRVIVFFLGEREQLGRVGQPRFQFVERADDLLQRGAFLPERLGAFGFRPDVGLFEFAADLYEALGLAVVVKDTPSTHWRVR